jgi:ribosomal RNA-processing protein 12
LKVPVAQPTRGEVFEDVLYGSESDIDDSDDQRPAKQKQSAKQKSAQLGARLRVDNDEPMDLLTGAAHQITSEYLFVFLVFF